MDGSPPIAIAAPGTLVCTTVKAASALVRCNTNADAPVNGDSRPTAGPPRHTTGMPPSADCSLFAGGASASVSRDS